ncbi:MAG: hypothetical protein H6633_18685 [Anaerolineales bacterium]|nr:hypothetical protein [Anaerolineales bacterium]
MIQIRARHVIIFSMALVFHLILVNMALAAGPGDLDPTFNGTGVVTTSISSGFDGGYAVAVQSDDKIVVTGVSNSDGFQDDFALVRYNRDGSLDSTFNSTGIVTTSIGPSFGYAVAVQPDKKIIVAGVAGRGDPNGSNFTVDFAIARYTPTGGLDPTFNSTGVVTTPVNAPFNPGNNALALQADGKIVVAGTSDVDFINDTSNIFIARYKENGSLDSGFNHTGIVTTHVSYGFDGASAVTIQPDQKIIIAGASNSTLAVARYTITGSLDSNFNGTGVITTPIGDGSSGSAVALQSDGKIVVAGTTVTNDDRDFVVVRYHHDGRLDKTFNGTGIAITDVGSDFDRGFGLALQPNGKIVVVGDSGSTIDNITGDFTTIRYNHDGKLDTTFGATGIVTTSLSIHKDEGHSVAIQADGKIVMAGHSVNGDDQSYFTVLRYLGDRTTFLPVIMKQ